jgi:CubicO group peptidase (beta-lactamase class C family)
MNKRIRRILQSGIDSGLYTTVSFGASIDLKRSFEAVTKYPLGTTTSAKQKVFDIASVTKLFLSILVYRLITIRAQFLLSESNRERAHRIAKFDLNTPIVELTDISGIHTEKLRLRHLLNFHAEFNTFSKPEEILVNGNIAGMFKEIRSVGLVCPPGEKFAYKNAHSILLGVVLEEVFGSTLEDLMQTHVCKPLGLLHTTANPLGMLCHVVHSGFCPVSKNEVQLGQVSDLVARLSYQQGRLLGSSGLFSTTCDVLTLLELIINNGSFVHHERMDFIHPSLIEVLSQSETKDKHFGTGMGLWNNFRKNLEKFNPSPVEDGLFKSGYSGIMTCVSRKKRMAFVCQTNFLHKLRSSEELKADRKKLHEVYASLAQAVIERIFDDNKLTECFPCTE